MLRSSTAFILGVMAFGVAHVIEVALWTTWFGGAYDPWFLNSARAAAFTIGWLFVTSLMAGTVELSGLTFSSGAVISMIGVLFLKPGGPGNIFPIVMLFAGLVIVGTSTLGAWAGKKIAGAIRRRR